jgi:hypothetical protein
MAWLEQRQPGECGELLRDYPDRVIRIDCRYCDRTGRYDLAWLVQCYGPAAALPEVLAALVTGCPRRENWRLHGPCGARFPDLMPSRRPSRWSAPT